MNKAAMAGVVLALMTCLDTAQAASVVTNTEFAEDLLLVDDSLWVATRGGIEVYGPSEPKVSEDGAQPDKARKTLITTDDGLARNHVVALSIVDGEVTARTLGHLCTMRKARFECKKTETYQATPKHHERHKGYRVTASVSFGGVRYVATAGDGVWRFDEGQGVRITPTRQICSNHITAIAKFAGRTWFGSFDEGLCSTTDMVTFKKHDFGARMINDLEVTPQGLFIAASEGLFLTRKGQEFERNTWVSQRGVNGLAFDGRSLFVSSLSCLWRLRISGGPRDKEWWAPGGSRSLQSVAASSQGVWLATEDRGLVHQTRDGFEVFDRNAGMPESWMLDVAISSNGDVYGATLREGVVRIRPSGAIQVVRSTSKEWGLFMGLVGDEVWFGSQAGVAKTKAKQKRMPHFDWEKTPHPSVHIVVTIGSQLLIGTEGGMRISAVK